MKVMIPTGQGRRVKYHKISDSDGDFVVSECVETDGDACKFRSKEFADRYYDPCKKCFSDGS